MLSPKLMGDSINGVNEESDASVFLNHPSGVYKTMNHFSCNTDDILPQNRSPLPAGFLPLYRPLNRGRL